MKMIVQHKQMVIKGNAPSREGGTWLAAQPAAEKKEGRCIKKVALVRRFVYLTSFASEGMLSVPIDAADVHRRS